MHADNPRLYALLCQYQDAGFTASIQLAWIRSLMMMEMKMEGIGGRRLCIKNVVQTHASLLIKTVDTSAASSFSSSLSSSLWLATTLTATATAT
ncbi:hypothetical protein ACLKA6_006925 [Drosophila palustris]